MKEKLIAIKEFLVKRLSNKVFVVSTIAYVLYLVGINEGMELSTELTEVIDIVFQILIGLGIVIDPTTSGITDGE